MYMHIRASCQFVLQYSFITFFEKKKLLLSDLLIWLQILTQYEGVIKRDRLSSDFETTEELLSYCAMSKGVGYNSARSGSVVQLPWIPQTAAAVALRFFELDAAIFYRLHEKPESYEEKKVENFIVSFFCLFISLFVFVSFLFCSRYVLLVWSIWVCSRCNVMVMVILSLLILAVVSKL